MSRYDGLIIPRSYSEYINKTDAATLSQALQLGGVLDSAPTEGSVKAVKSGGVYTALAGKQPTLTFDDVPTDGSNNPVKSNGIYDALATKQDTLTFDNVPTQNSDNPVKSGGVYTVLQNYAVIHYIDIEGTTNENGLLNLTLTQLPATAKPFYITNFALIVLFFNGSSSTNLPYCKIINYDGTPYANQTVSMRIFYF